MPKKPITGEKFSEPLNFNTTPAMARKVIDSSLRRGVSQATSLRWAVEFWLASGAPMPATEENEEIES